MKRVLLRLLLIVSFVMNGVAAPWVAVAAPEPDAAAMEDCHHEAAAPSDAADEPGCCEGPGCQCGCLLTSMPSWRFSPLPRTAWQDAPVTEPATRAVVRERAAPFRPPAA